MNEMLNLIRMSLHYLIIDPLPPLHHLHDDAFLCWCCCCYYYSTRKQWLSYYRHHELLPLVAPVGGMEADPAAAGGKAPSISGAPAGSPLQGTVLAPRTRTGPRDGKVSGHYRSTIYFTP
jgi:hypothetical protein